MKTSILQIAMIISWGNSYLQNNNDIENCDGFINNPCFKSCGGMEFIDMFPPPSDDAIEVIHANDALGWLKMLKEWGYTELRLVYYPNHAIEPRERRMVAAFAQVEEWMIETVREDESNIWMAEWHYHDDAPNAEAPWFVAYETIDTMAAAQPVQKQDYVVSEMRKCLGKTLTDLIDFAKEQGQEYFAQVFEEALQKLDDDNFENDGFCEYVAFKEDYSPQSLQLIRAIRTAWVFGGMGSWNDLVFSDPDTNKRYDELSDELYKLCCGGLTNAINYGFSKRD